MNRRLKIKLVCIVATILFFLFCFSNTLKAETEQKEYIVGNSTFYYTDEYGWINIVGYEGTDSVIEIPSQIDGMNVSSVDDDVFVGNQCIEKVIIPAGMNHMPYFDDCTNLSEVVIPEGVTAICGFKNCTSLSNIELPNTVEIINPECFKGCTSLESIVLPESVTYLNHSAFMDCTSLTSVIIPSGVSRIGAFMFKNCESLSNVTFHDDINEIGSFAFEGCTSLENVTLPKNLNCIEEQAFSNCTALKTIKLSNKIETMKSGVFCGCNNLETVDIENGIKSIPIDMFYGCTSLNSINIPESIEFIGAAAFAKTGLREVELHNPNIDIATNAFNSDIYSRENDGFVVKGVVGSSAEMIAKNNGYIFKSLDGTYEVDYANVVGCYDTALANYRAIIEYLDEFYIEKNPELALDVQFGGEDDRKFFTQVASEIISNNTNVEKPIALYNWMNENIQGEGAQYGYAMDVYNARTADCMGNAILLCELLRSADIPAVVCFGYAGDMKEVLNEKNLIMGKTPSGTDLEPHAWVLAYYNNQWMLLDSAMDEVLYDEEEICHWYYTQFVDGYLMIYNEMLNINIPCGYTSVCYKDGEYYNTYDCTWQKEGGSSFLVGEENVIYHWSRYSNYKYVDSGNPVNYQPGNQGWITDGKLVYYFKGNTWLAAREIRNIDDKLYYFGQNGYAFDVTDLKGKYRTLYGNIIVEPGTVFSINLVLPKEVDSSRVAWKSSDESIITLNSDGTFKVTDDLPSEKVVYAELVATIDGEGYNCIPIFVDNTVANISMESELTLKVGDTYKLNPTADKEMHIFGYRWESSDSSVAKVDNNGCITVLKEGTAEITATVTDGSGVSATCVVNSSNTSETMPDTTPDPNPAPTPNVEMVGEVFATNDGNSFTKDANGDIRCFDENGNPVVNQFMCDGEYTYYFGADKKAFRDRLTYHPDGEHVIYLDENGHEVFSDFAHISMSIAGDTVDDYCFFDTFGYMYVDVLTYDKTGTKILYANAYGRLECAGWFKFSETVKWADGTACDGIAGGIGYGQYDGTLLRNCYTYDWDNRLCYMQGNGVAIWN